MGKPVRMINDRFASDGKYLYDFQGATVEQNNDIELQLLVIDLGGSCVVKVENAENGDKLGSLYLDEVCVNATTLVLRHHFVQVRAAVDALEGKPVPRIEQHKDGYRLFREACMGISIPSYTRIDGSSGQAVMESHIDKDLYDALSAVAGKPLPIYTPTKGEWNQLYPMQCVDKETQDLSWWLAQAPVEIWRYIKRRTG